MENSIEITAQEWKQIEKNSKPRAKEKVQVEEKTEHYPEGGAEYDLEVDFGEVGLIGLNHMTTALQALSKQFDRYLEITRGYGKRKEGHLKFSGYSLNRLEFKYLEGDIIPLFENSPVEGFINYLNGFKRYFLGLTTEKEVEWLKNDLMQLRDLLEVVARYKSCNMSIRDKYLSKVVVSFTHIDAQQLQVILQSKIDSWKVEVGCVHERKILRWNQVKFDSTESGNKGIIDEFPVGAVKVVFADAYTKYQMTTNNPNFDKPWQELRYVVDVEVRTIKGEIKAYEIINFYPEETFDPEG